MSHEPEWSQMDASIHMYNCWECRLVQTGFWLSLTGFLIHQSTPHEDHYWSKTVKRKRGIRFAAVGTLYMAAACAFRRWPYTGVHKMIRLEKEKDEKRQKEAKQYRQWIREFGEKK